MKQSPKLQAQRARDLFLQAVDLSTATERAAFLDGACDGDHRLRGEVEALIAGANDPLLDQIAAEARPTVIEQAPGDGIEEHAGATIGRYKLLELLGEGGFGSVWLAEQKEPVRRKVALKVIKLGMDTRQVIARFEAEQQALALMDHPNIAKVLDAGVMSQSLETSDRRSADNALAADLRLPIAGSGRPYFVMELVRGTPITTFCDENRLSTRERLDLFIQVCHAVQHAHQKGIIHRDLKPSNVLVTLHDGVPVPKVIDFGIAKATQQELTDKTIHTMFQQFIGTPAYVSPEQAEMSGLDIDTRSDIYSLGVLLYELLTGVTPFDGKELLASGIDAMRRTIREKEPLRPSTRLNSIPETVRTTTAARRATDAARLTRLLRGDLDWIVMKCLEKDRARRYETANGLALDLGRHLHQEPVAARPPSRVYRLQTFLRRNKPAVAAAGLVAAALVLGALASLWQAVEAREARREALRHLYIANLNLAQQDYAQGNLQRVKRLLEETRNDPLRGFEWYYWQQQIHQDVRTLRGHAQPLRGVALSPDGRFAATASAAGVPGPNAKLWDLATGRELASIDSQAQCRAVAFSADGKRLAVGGAARLLVWDIAARREVFSLTNRFQAPVWSLAFSPDGQRIAIGLYQAPAVLIVDAILGRVLSELSDGTNRLFNVPSLGFSPDGSTLAAAEGASGESLVWSLSNGQLVYRLPGNTSQVWQLGFDPSGRRLVTAHLNDRTARVWNLESGTLEGAIEGHSQLLQCALFSPQGDRIYTAGWDSHVRVWNATSFREMGRLPKGHTQGIISMAVSQDGRHILTGSHDGEAKLWNTEEFDEPPAFTTALWPNQPQGLWRFFGTRRGPYATLSPTSNTGLILALAPSNQVVGWDFATQRELFRIQPHQTNQVSTFAVAPDLRRLVTAGDGGNAFVWDARTGARLFALENSTNKVLDITFSPDSRHIATAGADGTVRVWDDSGRLTRSLSVQFGAFTTSISPDQRWLAIGLNSDWSEIWNLTTGRRIHRLPHRAGGAFSFAWSPDGRRVASAGWDKVVRVWDIATGRLLTEGTGHMLPIWSVAYSPDGSRLVTGSMDRNAKVWDAATGRELLTLSGHADDVHSVAWSADGRRIVTGSDDQTMKIWEAATPEDVAGWQAAESEAARRIETQRNEPDQLGIRAHAPPTDGGQ